MKEKNYIVAEPDILTFNLNDLRPKFAILASDGLFDFFSNEGAVKFVKDKMEELLSNRFTMNKNELSLELAKQLTLEAYRRGSTDNITVVVWIFDYEPVKQAIKQSTSYSAIKEIKVQRTKKADELEDFQMKHRSRLCNNIVENKFAKDITYQTDEVTCDSTCVEFNVGEHLVDQDESSMQKETTDEDKKQEHTKKKCKKNRKFNLLNLELNLSKLSPEKEAAKSTVDELSKTKDEKTDEKSDETKMETEKVELNEEFDKNANSIYEVRLKDEYNLIRSPKKLKNTNQIANQKANQKMNQNLNPKKIESDQSDEFFDCK